MERITRINPKRKPDVSDRLPGLIQRVESQREVYLTLLEDLGEEPPGFVPPKLAGLPMDAAAKGVREWLGLQERNDFNSYRAAVEAKGILNLQQISSINLNTDFICDKECA